MSYIFRFHEGTNNNVIDWTPSDKITAADTKNVLDKTNIVSSGVGTSIPTPIARMFLFKTAFEIVAAQISNAETRGAVPDSIYARLVSETLDLLELLYKCGDDKTKIRYQQWNFEVNDNSSSFFGRQPGHQFLSQAFAQAASQEPFNNKISITLIYYKEGEKEVLVGGTSPFTFVFTSPNYKYKMENKFKRIPGLVTDDFLFDSNVLLLQDRDLSFIKYVEGLVNNPVINSSFNNFGDYVTNTRRRYDDRFDSKMPRLVPIHLENGYLKVSQIPLMQVDTNAYRDIISEQSDFRIDLPEDSAYEGRHTPLFLLDRMGYEGYQYTSSTDLWSQKTDVVEGAYPETTIAEIEKRILPGGGDFRYPFLSAFDFFEKNLVRLPGYAINDDRFITLTENQTFLLPIKPIFFQFFPVSKIHKFVTIEQREKEVIVTLNIPMIRRRTERWVLSVQKNYSDKNSLNYNGITGIYPFTKCYQPEFSFLNQYTVASYEKTVNAGALVDSIAFFREGREGKVSSKSKTRAIDDDINIKSTYYQLDSEFDIMQLNFKTGYLLSGGVILPKFKQVENGRADYIYAIDFGTSNTHVEYGLVQPSGHRKIIKDSNPFYIDQKTMQLFLLHKPKPIKDNIGEMDYDRSMGTSLLFSRKVAYREFMPFQILNIGAKKSDLPGAPTEIRFPFRTATCESDNFPSMQNSDCQLFLDANIGFNIDDDALSNNVKYTTDLKWLLQYDIADSNNINRISLFARQLMLMVRTKLLLEDNRQQIGNILTTKIVLAFPISMGDTIKNKLTAIFEEQRGIIFGPNSQPLGNAATESIAPYYQLRAKNSNIQNDNFCNIDIGGGTTDVVVTDTGDQKAENFNQLKCFGCSFRFAGKQLWGSGTNEFANLENGFVQYYRQLIQDRPLYNELHKAFDGEMRTEDLMGFLFSQSSFPFKNVFERNKEFRAVLLIHYSAILYYVARLIKSKGLKLPRTVSFSGKGSEYLSLVFPSNTDLKIFTQIILAKFAEDEVRSDFLVEKSDEPKVITAKGTLHFAVENVVEDDSSDWGVEPSSAELGKKKLIKSNVAFNCFADPKKEDENLVYDQLFEPEYLNDIIESCTDFLELLFSDDRLINNINSKLEIRDFRLYKQFFLPANKNPVVVGPLRDSLFDSLHRVDHNEKITDPPFFFPLNYSLVKLSKAIADKTVRS